MNRRQFIVGTGLALPSMGSALPLNSSTDPYIIVLGTAQDGGYPQAGCKKDCCKGAWGDATRRRDVASLGIVDPVSNQRWFIECTPSFPRQLRRLDEVDPRIAGKINGVLLTHAHIGHYTGLIHLGREVIGANGVPVYTMPRMEKFLRTQGPWSQLVHLKNIVLQPMRDGKERFSTWRFPTHPYLHTTGLWSGRLKSKKAS